MNKIALTRLHPPPLRGSLAHYAHSAQVNCKPLGRALLSPRTCMSQLEQISICKRFGAEYCSCADDLKVGVSRNILDGRWSWPVHGLRHQPLGKTTGWYIWSGELSAAPDFFQTLHVAHLPKYCKEALGYLGLPPGYRFLIAPEYEDVWFDEKLLDT